MRLSCVAFALLQALFPFGSLGLVQANHRVNFQTGFREGLGLA